MSKKGSSVADDKMRKSKKNFGSVKKNYKFIKE